jgi:hypothetical protein
MKIIRLDVSFNPTPAGPDVEVVLDEGRVSFSTESSTAAVDAPSAVYIPGRRVTRSLTAESPARVLAILAAFVT